MTEAATRLRPHSASMNRPGTSLPFDPARFTVIAATVLVGISAGFFFAYQASVTLGLAEVSDVAYVETFQAINATIRNPAFGLVFFGSVPAIALAIAANWRTVPPPARHLLTAALPLYLAGVVITASGNVPLNNELAEVTTLTAGRANAARAAFEADWNRLNLIRSVAVTASFVCLATASLVLPARDGVNGTGSDAAGQTEQP